MRHIPAHGRYPNSRTYGDRQARDVDQLLNVIVGLLGVSLLVAVLGVANTLSLSLLSRRRELGLLRAVGMDRREVASMILIQGLLTAALGVAVAVVVGAAIGSALVRALAPLGLLPGEPPVFLIAGGAMLTLVAGVTASLVPLRSHASLTLGELAAT